MLAVLITIVVFGAAFLTMTQQYPQMRITPEELYGVDLVNLRDFELDADGVLTATSSDPWITYNFKEQTNVRSVTISFSEVQSNNAVVECFLVPEYDSTMVDLHSGTVKLAFTKNQPRNHLEALRFDLTNHTGNSMKLDSVLINSRTDLFREMAGIYVCILCFLVLCATEIILWCKQIKQEQSNGSSSRFARMLSAAIVQGAFKVVVICALAADLVSSDLGSYQRLLSWMLVFGMEFACLCALTIRYFQKQAKMWWQLLPIPLWAVMIFAAIELMNIANYSFQNISYLFLNLLLFCLPVFVLSLVVHRVAIPLTICTCIFAIWGLANHFFGVFRSNPLEFSDIAQAGTALNVVGNYSLMPDAACVAAVASAIALSICFICVLGNKGWKWSKADIASGLGVGIGALAIAGVLLPTYGMTESSNVSNVTRKHGYLLSFAAYTEAGMRKDKPAEYSTAFVDQLLGQPVATSLSTGGGEYPNVIVIMNETFADLPSIYHFETDNELLPFIDQLQENTIKGNLLVSVFGGGTSNTEYEFLTGNSLYALPAGCCPYIQYMSKQQQSIAWNLKSLGYQTVAYHPFSGSGYRRAANYPLLGLDDFYDSSAELPNQDYMRSYLSDSSDLANLIYLYEQRDQTKPFFAFNVTMQNHGSYNASESEVPTTVKPLETSLQLPEMEEYLSLVHESDRAFSELVDYFSGVDENTIILMFGDHQPSLSERGNEALAEWREGHGAYGSNSWLVSSFVIWANFDIDEAENVLSSPNYLRALLLDQAGIELNPYEQFLLDVSKIYPAINSNGYYDNEMNWHSREETDPEGLQEYKCLVYNNVFDKRHIVSEYYEH